jgi:hypothetical protein
MMGTMIAPIVLGLAVVLAVFLLADPQHGTLVLFGLYGIGRVLFDVWKFLSALASSPRDKQTQSQTTYTYVNGNAKLWFRPLNEREQGAWER